MLFYKASIIKFTILSLLLCLASCRVKFGHGKGNKKKYNVVKHESIYDIFRNGKKIEYIGFKDWKNEYLDDINFDIFVNSNGSRVGILNNTKVNYGGSLMFKNNVTQVQLNDLLKEVDNQANLNWRKDDEVNSILTYFNAKKINAIFMQNIVAGENFINTDEEKYYYGNEREKSLGSNSKVKLIVKNFSDIDNFTKDQKIADSVISFARSCDVFLSQPDRPVETKNISLGKAEDWHDVCLNIKKFKLSGLDANMARNYFQKNFIPVKVYQNKSGKYDANGTFTGYYELDLSGSEKKDNVYKYPIYSLPPECKNSQCKTRGEINDGKLSGRGLELYWAKSPLDIFLLQIQGSGIISLDNGSFGRVGFAGSNRRRGSNIFLHMKKKCIPKCNASLPEIIEWFDENPNEGNDLLSHTDSYVFFRKLPNNGDGAIGSQGVPLIPSRSMAVDRTIIPYGVPLWVQTHIAVKDFSNSYIKMSRMMIAQDSGDAIQGAVRGDIFYGHGTKAKYLAEKQKFPGVYFMLIPKNVISKVRVK